MRLKTQLRTSNDRTRAKRGFYFFLGVGDSNCQGTGSENFIYCTPALTQKNSPTNVRLFWGIHFRQMLFYHQLASVADIVAFDGDHVQPFAEVADVDTAVAGTIAHCYRSVDNGAACNVGDSIGGCAG